MNWQLVIFAVIGLVVVFGYELNKTGFNNINWPKTGLRYALLFVIVLTLTYLSDKQPIKDVLMLAAAGGLAVFSEKVFK